MTSNAAIAAPVSPLRKTQMRTFDPDVMTVALQEGVLEHVQLERGVFRGQISHTATAGSRVDWGRYELSVLARGDVPQDMVTVAVALTGKGDWRAQGNGTKAGDMVIFPERSELADHAAASSAVVVHADAAQPLRVGRTGAHAVPRPGARGT